MDMVSINGLLNANTKLELKVVDTNGQPKKLIKGSLHEILMGLNVNTVCLWQVVMMAEKCGLEGYYPNGKGSVSNCEMAIFWVGNLVGHLCFYLLKQGMKEESVKDLLVDSLSSNSVVMEEESHEEKYMRVISRSQ